MKDETLAEFTGELCNSFNGDLRRVIEIIDNDGLKPSQQELKNRVASNVSNTAGD